MQRIRMQEAENLRRLIVTDTDTHSVHGLDIELDKDLLRIGFIQKSLLEQASKTISIEGVDNVADVLKWAVKTKEETISRDGHTPLGRFLTTSTTGIFLLDHDELLAQDKLFSHNLSIDERQEAIERSRERTQHRAYSHLVNPDEVVMRSFNYQPDRLMIKEELPEAMLRIPQRFVPFAEWLVQVTSVTSKPISVWGRVRADAEHEREFNVLMLDDPNRLQNGADS